MPTNNDGIMVILSSPSGAGKTTLVNLISKNDNFEISTSHTTRQPRLNEVNGKDYHFVNEKEFKTVDLKGMEFNPILGKWKRSDNLSVNYIICSSKL